MPRDTRARRRQRREEARQRRKRHLADVQAARELVNGDAYATRWDAGGRGRRMVLLAAALIGGA